MAIHRDTPTAPTECNTASASREAFLLLRSVFTVAPILFGLDKFLGLLTDWDALSRPAGRRPGAGHRPPGDARRRCGGDRRRPGRRGAAAHRRLRRRRVARRHHREPAAHRWLRRHRPARLRAAGRRAGPGPPRPRLRAPRPPRRTWRDRNRTGPVPGAAGRPRRRTASTSPAPSAPRPLPGAHSGWRSTPTRRPRHPAAWRTPTPRCSARARSTSPRSPTTRTTTSWCSPRHPGALGLRTPHAAVPRHGPRRVPAGAADPRAVQARARGRAVRPAPPGPGAADRPGGRLATDQSAPARRRGRRRGRAPVHDPARRPDRRNHDHDLDDARCAAAGCALARRVPRPHLLGSTGGTWRADDTRSEGPP